MGARPGQYTRYHNTGGQCTLLGSYFASVLSCQLTVTTCVNLDNVKTNQKWDDIMSHSVSECGFQVPKTYQAAAHIWGLPRWWKLLLLMYKIFDMRTFGLSHQFKGPTTVKVAKTGFMRKIVKFTITGPLIWCDNPQVRMSKILYINNNNFHHLGRSQMCAGGCYVFRASQPHSGTLCPVLLLIIMMDTAISRNHLK